MGRPGSDPAPGGRAGDGASAGWSPPVGPDIIELGRPRSAGPGRGRPAVVGLVVAVVVAGLLGYLIGRQHPGTARPAPSAAPSTYVGPDAASSGFAQAADRCSVQVGSRLQVGVDVANRSGSAVTLRGVRVTLPLGGLRVVATAWGTCGQLSTVDGNAPYLLEPGASAWLTVTLDVLVACPTPLPVQLALDYTRAGRADVAYLGGFPDLGGVPYTGCSASPS